MATSLGLNSISLDTEEGPEDVANLNVLPEPGASRPSKASSRSSAQPVSGMLEPQLPNERTPIAPEDRQPDCREGCCCSGKALGARLESELQAVRRELQMLQSYCSMLAEGQEDIRRGMELQRQNDRAAGGSQHIHKAMDVTPLLMEEHSSEQGMRVRLPNSAEGVNEAGEDDSKEAVEPAAEPATTRSEGGSRRGSDDTLGTPTNDPNRQGNRIRVAGLLLPPIPPCMRLGSADTHQTGKVSHTSVKSPTEGQKAFVSKAIHDRVDREFDETIETQDFEQSIWDVALFLGKFMGWPQTIIGSMLFCFNLVMQLLFAQLIYEIAQDSNELVLPQGQEGLLLWRLSVGHHISEYDELTSSSLVSRVCKKYMALTTSSLHAEGFDAFDKFLTHDMKASETPSISEALGLRTGEFLCLLVLIVWNTIIIVELRDILKFIGAVMSLPRGKTTDMEKTSDGKVQLKSLGRRRLLLLWPGVIIPRTFVAVVLLHIGNTFLIDSSSLSDLILNAVALGFVFDLDELFFNLLPSPCQRVVTNTEPLEIRSDIIPTLGIREFVEKHLYGLTEFIFIIALASTVIGYNTILMDNVDKINQGKKILCDGNQDFVYTTNRATGAIFYHQGTEEELFFDNLMFVEGREDNLMTLAMSAALERTLLPSDSSLQVVQDLRHSSWAFTLGAEPNLSMHADIKLLSDMFRESEQQAVTRLECLDMDRVQAERLALFSTVLLAENPQASGNQTDCGGLMKLDLCGQPHVRRRCPITCKCTDLESGNYDLDGCPPSCADVLNAEINLVLQELRPINAPQCVDAPAKHHGDQTDHSSDSTSSEWWMIFFADLQLYLEDHGLLQAHEGSWIWTPLLQSTVLRRTYGQYRLEDGVLIDLVDMAFAASTPSSSGGVGSPCLLEGYLRTIFDLDLCKTEIDMESSELLSTLAVLCPLQCGHCRVRAADGAEEPLGAQGPKWYWREILLYQEEHLGVKLVSENPPDMMPLSCGANYVLNTLGRANYGYLEGPDAVFSFEAKQDMFYTLDLCSPKTYINAVVRVLNGSWVSRMDQHPELLVHEDDGACGPGHVGASLSLSGFAPGLHLVWIDGPESEGGQFELKFRCSSTPLYWEVSKGACEVARDSFGQSCIRSAQYPSAYAESEDDGGCVIDVFPAAWREGGQHPKKILYPNAFLTEPGDGLSVQTMDGQTVTYAGDVFSSLNVTPKGSIVWTVDGVDEALGISKHWEICASSFSVQPWVLEVGPCQRFWRNSDTASDCIASPNYPEEYSNHDYCYFSIPRPWNADQLMQVELFDTEERWDILVIDQPPQEDGVIVSGRGFSGVQAHNGSLSKVQPTSNIIWTSDVTFVEAGWLLCVTPERA